MALHHQETDYFLRLTLFLRTFLEVLFFDDRESLTVSSVAP
ncbi:uncharacterized protein METZ01_LOCUS324097 [marine metagenome]|uniref:Uncharacterized protein n=1 Tax=marine metagenome TaxID=408172 RepID=A0A382PCX6_9ZZZZ